VLDRHLTSREGHDAGAEPDVILVERGAEKRTVRHGDAERNRAEALGRAWGCHARASLPSVMGTPWDRAAAGYVEEWVPRFVPYHLDLVRELALRPGQRVLVTSAGPGAEALAVARAVGETGRVRATDVSEAMTRLCVEQVKRAAFSQVECAVADARDVQGGPWDAVICAFGLWQIDARGETLEAWRDALAPQGKVGIVTWGPPEADDPFERLGSYLAELEPEHATPSPRILASRESMASMFEEAGLAMVRHTVVRHVMSFRSAEALVRALREACSWRRVWETIGDARMARVAARFYDWVGGPDAPVTFQPPATLAIAALPGAEVELAHRPSVRVPAVS
jgi:ubiquinone/menaquinone biosynthesis C-methylase UbiE